MRVLVDTNGIIDSLQSRADFLADAREVLLRSSDYDGYIAASSITDIFYLQKRFFHDKDKARRSLSDLLKLFGILDTTADDCKNALRSGAPDFEDTVMIETALREGMDAIVTRNIKDYEGSSIKVYTPTEFIEILD